MSAQAADTIIPVWEAGSKLLATSDSLGFHFPLTDWLGTKRIQANELGIVDLTCVSLPYGNGPDCVGDNATEHRFTGKERDTESGNDYFGSRYYSSGMGRFMSPDWAAKAEPVPYAKLGDPQTLNLYAYVGNNPMDRTDPTGHYVTGCTAKKVTGCDANTLAFEAGRQKDLHSQDKQVRNAAMAYGKYGQKGVDVTFNPQAAGGGEVTFNRDSSGKATGTVTANITPHELSQGGTALDAIVAHEGTHVEDDEKLIGSGYKVQLDITHRATEEHAYDVENRVINTELNRHNPDWDSKEAVDNYINAHPDLYPNPEAPILAPGAIPQ